MKIMRVGVDIGKQAFHVCAVTDRGEPVWRKALKRHNWLEQLTTKVEIGVEVGMEACGGAHHWARELDVGDIESSSLLRSSSNLMSRATKTDRADAEAIAEAMSRPKMRFVPIKSVAQQDIQALHRVRGELIKQRTAKANQIRGLVAEYGLVAPQSLNQLRRAVPYWLEDVENGLTGAFRQLLSGLHGDLHGLGDYCSFAVSAP